jgi:hypothetical protein
MIVAVDATLYIPTVAPGSTMNNLGQTFSALERYHDALVIQEKTLEFFRRTLPENHPDIGAVQFWLVI